MADPTYLIVFLPGIGGTCLAAMGPGGAPERDRSGRPIYAWSADASDFPLLVAPERLSVAEAPRLVPVGLVPSRKAFGVWTAIHGYDGVLRRLAAKVVGETDLGDRPEDPNWDAILVAMGYDFRLGVADAAAAVHERIAARVARLWPRAADRRGRVILVGHSMGGLVARYWAGVLDDQRWAKAVVTIGTPHRGAPKALDVLANGLPLPWVTGRLSEVLRGWQGVYDLLPRYPAVLDDTIPDAEARARQDGSALLRPSGLGLAWDRDRVIAAEQMHAAIDTAWGWFGLDGPALSYRVGFGHATPQRCTWDGRHVRVTKSAPVGPGLGAWGSARGDGTVPAFCAVPVGRDSDPPTGVTSEARHGPMAAIADVDVLLGDLCAMGTLDFYREADEDRLSLGLSLPEVITRGGSIPLRAEVWRRAGAVVEPVTADVGDHAVWASVREVRPDGMPSPAVRADIPLVWDGDGGTFAAELPPLPPGLFEVEVTAGTLTDERARETIQVIEDERGA